MARQKSILLYGEGKTEAVFLNHLRSLYAEPGRARVLVDAGQGGGPRQVAERMIKKHLDLASYDRSLLLLDEDVPSCASSSRTVPRKSCPKQPCPAGLVRDGWHIMLTNLTKERADVSQLATTIHIICKRWYWRR